MRKIFQSKKETGLENIGSFLVGGNNEVVFRLVDNVSDNELRLLIGWQVAADGFDTRVRFFDPLVPIQLQENVHNWLNARIVKHSIV